MKNQMIVKEKKKDKERDAREKEKKKKKKKKKIAAVGPKLSIIYVRNNKESLKQLSYENKC